MIAIDQATLDKYPDRQEELKQRMAAIECAIRKATNNNFQHRGKRFRTQVEGGVLPGSPPWFKAGDTVEITGAGAWDGLYTVVSAAGGVLTLDDALEDGINVTVTRIEYPADVVAGANDMLRWDFEHRPHAGVKSETLSRHSVTYLDLDATNARDGYPAVLTAFMTRYQKARF